MVIVLPEVDIGSARDWFVAVGGRRAYDLAAILVVVGWSGVSCQTADSDLAAQASPETSESSSQHSFHDPRQAAFVSADELVEWRETGKSMLLVDVRSPSERAEAHIPDDVWLPLADLVDGNAWLRIASAPEQLTILYCDCPNAEAAYASVSLQDHGVDATRLRVLREGLAGWTASGQEVVTAADPCTEDYWPIACGQKPPSS